MKNSSQFKQIPISKCDIIINTNKKRNNLQDLIIRANLIHNNKYKYDNIKVHKNMHEKVLIECEFHGVFEQSLHSHINKKRGCAKCAIENATDTKVNFIIKSKQVHGDEYDYSKVNYINSRTKVIIVCSIHGDFEQKPNDHISSSAGCPICKESKGERIIRNFLDQNSIKYEYQKAFDDCIFKSQLFFDFYLIDYNLCIEYDGEQHDQLVEYWGGINGLEMRKIRDNIKNEYCINNNIKLLRIRYSDKIEEKLYDNIKNNTN